MALNNNGVLQAKVLCLLCLGMLAMSEAQTQTSAIIPAENGMDTKPKRNICLVYYEAIVYCEASQDPSTYTGYEVELFRKVAEWVEGMGYPEWSAANYTFTCIGFDELMNDLLLPNTTRTCDIGVAGISATSDRMAAGYEFTYPTYQSGRQILIFAPDTVDMFLFLAPFDKVVWLVIMATSVFVGIAVLFAEVPMRRIIRSPQPTMQKYLNLQWASTAMLLQAMQQFSAKTVGARIIILGYAFMVLILINAYIAVLSSQLTVTSINLNIHGLSDLTSKAVGIFQEDVNAFKKFNLQSVQPLSWNSADDEAHMLSLLRAGTITALILDKPFTDYQAASQCDLYVVGEIILPNNLAFTFPPGTSMDYVNLFSRGLTLMEETGVMGDLQTQFIKPSGVCPNKSGGNLANSQITMPQVAGLWVFLAVSVVVGYGWNVGVYLYGKWKVWKYGDDEEGLGGLGQASFGRQISISKNQISPSDPSLTGSDKHDKKRLGSMGRSMSIIGKIGDNPDMQWLQVADASTAEEMIELLELQVQAMDKRLKTLVGNVENKFNMVLDAVDALRVQGGPVHTLTDQKLDPGMEALPSFSSAKKPRGKTTSFAGVASPDAPVLAKVVFDEAAASHAATHPPRLVTNPTPAPSTLDRIVPRPPGGAPPQSRLHVVDSSNNGVAPPTDEELDAVLTLDPRSA